MPITVGHNGQRRAGEAHARAVSAREQALAVFDLEPPFTALRLKARYKVLVKHAPSGRAWRRQECRGTTKIINQAYATLKASYFD